MPPKAQPLSTTGRSRVDGSGLRRVTAGEPCKFALHLMPTAQPSKMQLRLKVLKAVDSSAPASRERARGAAEASTGASSRRRSASGSETSRSTTHRSAGGTGSETDRSATHRGATAQEPIKTRGIGAVVEEHSYDVASSVDKEESFHLEFGPLPLSGQYHLTMTLHQPVSVYARGLHARPLADRAISRSDSSRGGLSRRVDSRASMSDVEEIHLPASPHRAREGRSHKLGPRE